MPSAMYYVPPTENERNDFNGEVEHERRVRRNRYRLALQYYLGEHPDQLPVDRDDEDPVDDNTIINLVQMTADRTIAFLFPSMPKIETDAASVVDTDEEIWLKKVLEANGGLQSFVKLGLRGFLSGHAFLRVKPNTKRKNGYPSVTVLDPTAVTVYWRADDVSDVLWYEMRYMVGSSVYIQDFVHNEADDTWIIYTYRAIGAVDNNNPFPGDRTSHGGAHVVALDQLEFSSVSGRLFEQEGKPAIHRSSIPPVIEFPHLPHPDDYYGMGEFTQQVLQDTINKIASLQNKLVRENADPVDVITGADVEDVEAARGIMTIANAAARVNRLELRGDLGGIRGTLDKLIETYLAVARVVLLKGEAKDLQRVTNASVRTLFLDALSKNELLQSAYGYGLKRMAQLLLEMGYSAKQIMTNPATLDIRIKFPTPLPVDDTEIANQNAIMVGMGARSKRTAAQKMGDDWQFELAAQSTEEALEDERARTRGDIAAENAKKLNDATPAQQDGGEQPPQ